MNVQFAVKEGLVYLIEVNPRASRTVPFVAKAIGAPVAKIAARVMAGEKLADLPSLKRTVSHIAVKEAVFPFARFPGVDPVLSPEMKSTGEVMGIDRDFPTAFLKSQQGGGDHAAGWRDGVRLGQGQRQAGDRCAGAAAAGIGLLGGRDRRHRRTSCRRRGWTIGLVNKVAQGRPHIVDKIKDGEIAIVFNTTEGWQSHKDSASIRASSVQQHVPYFTTAASSIAVALAIAAARTRGLEVRSLQDYYSGSDG